MIKELKIILLASVLVQIGFCDVTLSDGGKARENVARRKRALYQSEKLTTPERAESEGYRAETHHVTTEDGYILELHRIPRGLDNNNITSEEDEGGQSRPVILLMHCLLCSSNDWLMNYPDKALGFIFADHGYDVWMPNARGNVYSRRHLYLSPKRKEFWSFSWHEIGYYDLAASIDYILNVTGEEKLTYLGYSLGSPMLLALMSERPEYNQKVKSAVILSPVSYLKHSNGPFFILSPFVNVIEKFANKFGMWEVSLQGNLSNMMATSLCTTRNIFLKDICLMMYSKLIHINEDLANYEFLPFIISHMMSGGSLRTILHQMQIRNSDRFQKYNYGRRKNLKIYGTPEPPLYHINRTEIPLALFTAVKDEYVDKTDLDKLVSQLPNVAINFQVDDPRFTHFNFLWLKEPWEILYKHIIKFVDDHQ